LIFKEHILLQIGGRRDYLVSVQLNMLIIHVSYFIKNLTISQIAYYLPPHLTVLKFNNTVQFKFNIPVDHLPSSFISTNFHNNFNQPVDYLLDSLTHITFSYSFNQSIDNLSQLFTHLTFS
jgi:hypothetical protein